MNKLDLLYKLKYELSLEVTVTSSDSDSIKDIKLALIGFRNYDIINDLIHNNSSLKLTPIVLIKNRQDEIYYRKNLTNHPLITVDYYVNNNSYTIYTNKIKEEDLVIKIKNSDIQTIDDIIMDCRINKGILTTAKALDNDELLIIDSLGVYEIYPTETMKLDIDGLNIVVGVIVE